MLDIQFWQEHEMEDAVMPYIPDSEPGQDLQLAFEEKYLETDGLLGIGLTDGDRGELAIVVYLQSKGPEANLPTEFRGHQVIIEVVGAIDAY